MRRKGRSKRRGEKEEGEEEKREEVEREERGEGEKKIGAGGAVHWVKCLPNMRKG